MYALTHCRTQYFLLSNSMLYIYRGFELTRPHSSAEQVPLLHYKIIYRIYNIIIIKYTFQFYYMKYFFWGFACFFMLADSHLGIRLFFWLYSAQHITFDFLRFSCCEWRWCFTPFSQIKFRIHGINHALKSFRLMQIGGVFLSVVFFVVYIYV